MGPGRAYRGDSIWLTGYFRATPYYRKSMGKKHQHPQTHPFIVGDGWNRVLADDIFGVITLNVPST